MTLPFSQPVIEEAINRMSYQWDDMSLLVLADRLTDAGSAELWFYHNNGTGKSLLHTSKVNLLSTSTMTQVKKRMIEHSTDIPWQEVLTCITSKTMEYQRKGEPGLILKPNDTDSYKPTYYIEPIIMKGVPNVIYGDKGVNKTTIGLTALGILAIGYLDSPSGLTAGQSANVGILDWESTFDLTSYTLSRLVESGTIPYCEPSYLRCKQRLADDIDRVANWVTTNNIKAVLIDSLGQAAGSDKFDNAGKNAALSFFECLRLLNVTSLIIAQNAKSEDNRKTIYGSTYYTYYSRNVFELKRAKDTSRDDDMHIALLHQEGNYSKKYNPLGFHLTYTDTSILIETEVVNLAQLKDRIEDTDAILEFLRQAGKLCTIKAISEAIEKNDNRTRVVLSILKKRGKVVNPATGLWGAATNDK